MLKDILAGRYPMPWRTFFITLLCLVYVLSPIDFLPEMLPVLGVTDDITFIVLVVLLIRQEIAKYRATLSARPAQEDVIDIGDIKDHKK